MNDSQQIREQLWDLVYGLLTPDESEALIARVKSDPQIARLYAEVCLQADLVAHASRVEDPQLHFQVEPGSRQADPPTPADRHAALARGARGSNWLVAVAATALAGLLAVGIFWPQPSPQQLAENTLAIDVSGPESMPAGITNKLSFKTYHVSVEGARYDDATAAGEPADVEVELLDARHQVRFHQFVRTAADGRADVELPGHAIEPEVRLKVTARKLVKEKVAKESESKAAETSPAPADPAAQGLARRGDASTIAAALPVQPEPMQTYIVLSSPVARPGDEIHFSAINIKPFSGEATPADVSQITVDNAEGVAVAAPMWTSNSAGVVEGKLQLPADLPTDNLSLTLRESSGYESQTRLGRLLADNRAVAPRYNYYFRELEGAERRKQQDEQLAQKAEGAAEKPSENKLTEKAAQPGDDAVKLTRSAPAAASAPGTTGAPATGAVAQNASPANDPSSRAFGFEASGGAAARGGLAGAGAPAGGEALAKAYAFKSLGEQSHNRATRGLQLATDTLRDSYGERSEQKEVPVVAAGQPVSVPIPAEQADNKRLFAIANCRGVNVASAPVTFAPVTLAAGASRGEVERSSGGPRTYSLALPPEADGEIEVALVDRSQETPRLVERQWFFRQPARKLNIEVAGMEGTFAPGEHVQVTLQATDESGAPAADAKLVVRLWKEQLAQDYAAPITLDDMVRGRESQVARADNGALEGMLGGAGPKPTGAPAAPSGEVVKGGELAKAKQSDSKQTDPKQAYEEKADATKEGEQKLAAAQRGWDRFGTTHNLAILPQPTDAESLYSENAYLAYAPSQTVKLASTRQLAEAEYAAALADAQAQRRTTVRTLGGAALIGSAALLLLTGAWLVQRRPGRGRILIVPAVAIAAASLAMGLVWIGRWPLQQAQQIALAPAPEAAAPAPTAAEPKMRHDFDLAEQAPAPITVAASDGLPNSGAEATPAAGYRAPLASDMPGRAPEPPPAAAPTATPLDPAVLPPAPPAEAIASSAPLPTRPAAPAPSSPASPAPTMRAMLPAAPPAPAATPAPAPVAGPVAAASAAPATPELKAQAQLGTGKSLDNIVVNGQSQAESRKGVESLAPQGTDKRTADREMQDLNKKVATAGARPAGSGQADGGQVDGVNSLGMGRRGDGGAGAPGPGGLGAAESSNLQQQVAGGAGQRGAGRGSVAKGGGAASRVGGFGGGGGGFGNAPAPGGLPGAAPLSPVAGTPLGDRASGKDQSLAWGDETRAKAASAAAPAALYFNPQLVTDSNGRATFEFTLPESQADYRLLVDALGKGRLGSQQQLLVGTKPAEAKPAAETAPAQPPAAPAADLKSK